MSKEILRCLFTYIADSFILLGALVALLVELMSFLEHAV
jgi:hypothetical protein